jgi:hypothetical protein
MFIHSKEVLGKGKIKYPSQVIYEGDIKRLLNATSHLILMNLMFRMNLLSLTNFIFIKASNLSC